MRCSLEILRVSETGRIASFICGIDSPVSEASFATAVPDRSKQSHGTIFSAVAAALAAFSLVLSAADFLSVPLLSAPFFLFAIAFVSDFFFLTSLAKESGCVNLMDIKSPGRTLSVVTSLHSPPLNTFTIVGFADIPLSELMVLIRWNTDADSNIRIEISWNTVYCQYSSRAHRIAQKTWKTTMGETSCSLYKSRNLGGGTES
mmetsp:Transcript_16443/g.24778  ORF Transcript_16443/g.24778 Transcript_16443/m.24778 type:complete len:203 (-) Transcript_16443:900-1508(-)